MLLSSTAWTGSARLVIGGLVGGLAFAPIAPVYALPVGGTVAAGTASIAGTKSAVTINQSSQNAVINWQRFSIGKTETVTFDQPNASSAALNRVVGADPTTILGSLSANGKVFIVNPNGVLFAKGAQVNVGGLAASTLGITDSNFMANNDQFAGTSTAGVANKGAINANGGYVALLGAKVSNDGVITARLGSVVLAAGSAMTLDVAGDGLLNVAVSQGAMNALARNGGVIKADGGQVMMTAKTAGQLLKTVVNNTGVIEAQSIDTHNGTIKLLGDTAGGIVAVSGTLDVSGAKAGQTGGTIVVAGNAIVLRGHAKLNASGAAGGGSVSVGGNAAGQTTTGQTTSGQTATTALAAKVTMGASVVIAADAVTTGNGGSVVLRSAGVTQVLGTITARGGATSGNGGQVETSGLQVTTGAATSVNTLAPNGTTGLWLLDPVNYNIALVGGDETPAQVAFSLATSDRVISATNDITVSSALSWSTPQRLTLDAGNQVTINAPVTASTSGAGLVLIGGQGVIINAPVTASGIGNLVQMTALSGDLNINAAITASASGARVLLNAGHDIDINAATSQTLGGVVSASGGGSITMMSDTLGVPGPTGGAVNICPACAVTSTVVTIYYSPPNGYSAPTPYTGFTAYEWVFVQAYDKVYDGTTAATAKFYGDPTVGGTIIVGLTGGNISFVDKNAGVNKSVSFSGYSLDGSGAGAYKLFAGTGLTTASITPAPLTITADSASKLYGQVATLAPTAFIAQGLKGNDTISSVSESSLGTGANAGVAGGPYSITAGNASGGGFVAANYNTTYLAGTLSVNPAPLTVQADNAVKTYGQTVSFSPNAFTSTGLKNGDTIAGVTESSLGAVATASVANSPYSITPSNAVGGTYIASNYTTIYLPGILSITPAALVVTANNATKTYGQTLSFAPSAFSASGLQNGQTIGAVTEASPGAAASASVAGSPYAITASNATGGSFIPSNYNTSYDPGTLLVTPAALTVTANSVVKTVGVAISFPATAFTASGLQNNDSIAGVTETSPGAGAAAAVGLFAITPSNAVGANFVPSNYNTNYAAGVLTTIAAVVIPPVVTPPVVTPPVVTPPVVTPPVVTPPVVTPPVVTPPVVTPPVVVTPVVTPPVETPPVVTPPVVTPPVETPPVVTPPVVVTPVDTPTVVTPPLVITPVETPSAVNMPVMVSPAVSSPVAAQGNETPLVDTSPAATQQSGTSQVVATSDATQPGRIASNTNAGAGSLPAAAAIGFPLIVVGQGVRMPVYTPAPVPADAAAAGEYPAKPDRN